MWCLYFLGEDVFKHLKSKTRQWQLRQITIFVLSEQQNPLWKDDRGRFCLYFGHVSVGNTNFCFSFLLSLIARTNLKNMEVSDFLDFQRSGDAVPMNILFIPSYSVGYLKELTSPSWKGKNFKSSSIHYKAKETLHKFFLMTQLM